MSNKEGEKKIQKTVKKAKANWIGIDICMNKTNSKRAFQLVMDLTLEKQERSSTIQDRSGKCLLKNKRFSADGQNFRAKSCRTLS